MLNCKKIFKKSLHYFIFQKNFSGCVGEYKNDNAGRSMLEMFGVLAIIGILSIGGMAGYSKAMEKIKANKLVGEYNNLIWGLFDKVDDIHRISTNNGAFNGIVDYVQALSLVPETWQKVSSYKLYDSEKNIVQVFSRNNRLVVDFYIGGQISNSLLVNTKGFSANLCQDIMSNIVKNFSNVLYYFRLIQWSKNDENATIYWGDRYCLEKHNCLRNLTISEISSLCQLCKSDKETCGINIEF